MAHYPVNHHLRPLYRFLAGLAGLYLLLVGVIGIVISWGEPFFNRGANWSLGLRVNPASALLYAVLGLIVLGAALIGGNIHHAVNRVFGWVLVVLAILLLTMIQTEANVLNLSMVNVILLVILGLVTLTAGLYGKVGTPEEQRLEEEAEHPVAPHH